MWVNGLLLDDKRFPVLSRPCRIFAHPFHAGSDPYSNTKVSHFYAIFLNSILKWYRKLNEVQWLSLCLRIALVTRAVTTHKSLRSINNWAGSREAKNEKSGKFKTSCSLFEDSLWIKGLIICVHSQWFIENPDIKKPMLSCTSKDVIEEESTWYAYLMRDNNRETGCVLLEKFVFAFV